MALTNGLVVMTPSSVAKTGTGSTATINGDGSVVFSTCETLSLNGVFTTTYDNYMVVVRFRSTAEIGMRYRLRSSGTDNSTASSYVSQTLNVDGTTVNGTRFTSDAGLLPPASNVQRCGATIYLFGPRLAQPTAARGVSASDLASARIYDPASTHNQSTAYDGLTLYPTSDNISGLITVFGFNQ